MGVRINEARRYKASRTVNDFVCLVTGFSPFLSGEHNFLFMDADNSVFDHMKILHAFACPRTAAFHRQKLTDVDENRINLLWHVITPLFLHRHDNVLFLRYFNGTFITRIRMTDNAHSWVAR